MLARQETACTLGWIRTGRRERGREWKSERRKERDADTDKKERARVKETDRQRYGSVGRD